MFANSLNLGVAFAAVAVLVATMGVGSAHLLRRTIMPQAETIMTRVQIELAEDRVKELNDLMERCGLTTKKDLFNNAMSILEWAVEEVEAGNSIASVNKRDQRYEVLRMPILDAASKRMPRQADSVSATRPARSAAHVKVAT